MKLALSLGEKLPPQGAGPVPPIDTNAYFTYAGITDNTEKTAINDFVTAIDSLHQANKLYAIWPISPTGATTPAAARAELLNPGATTDLAEKGGGTLTYDAGGIEADGSSMLHPDGGITLTSLAADPTDFGVSFYSQKTAEATNVRVALIDATVFKFTTITASSGKETVMIGDSSPATPAEITPSNFGGLITGVRSGTVQKAYRFTTVGSITGTGTGSAAFGPVAPPILGDIFTPSSYTPGPTGAKTSFFAWHKGFSPAEQAVWSAAVQQLQTDLSRAIAI